MATKIPGTSKTTKVKVPAKKKSEAAKKKKRLADDQKYKPADYLKGGAGVGQKYTAYNTYSQGKPDFGKSTGPGDPYHEVSKKIPRREDAMMDYAKRKRDAAKAKLTTPITGEAVDTKVKAYTNAKSGTVLGKSTSRLNQGSDYRSAAIRRRLGGLKWKL